MVNVWGEYDVIEGDVGDDDHDDDSTDSDQVDGLNERDYLIRETWLNMKVVGNFIGETY